MLFLKSVFSNASVDTRQQKKTDTTNSKIPMNPNKCGCSIRLFLYVSLMFCISRSRSSSSFATFREIIRAFRNFDVLHMITYTTTQTAHRSHTYSSTFSCVASAAFFRSIHSRSLTEKKINHTNPFLICVVLQFYFSLHISFFIWHSNVCCWAAAKCGTCIFIVEQEVASQLIDSQAVMCL